MHPALPGGPADRLAGTATRIQMRRNNDEPDRFAVAAPGGKTAKTGLTMVIDGGIPLGLSPTYSSAAEYITSSSSAGERRW